MKNYEIADSEKSKYNHSIMVGFKILSIIAENNGKITLANLSQQIDMPKSQLSRYLNSFQKLGVLIKETNEAPIWSLGFTMVELGKIAEENFDINQQVAPIVMELKAKTNETVALSIFTDNGPKFINLKHSSKALHIGLDIGSYVPIYTATGIIYRHYLDQTLTNHLFERAKAKDRFDVSQYEKTISFLKENGFAYSHGTLVNGVFAISAPIFYANNSLAGALSIITFGDDNLLESTICNDLLFYANKASKLLGYQE